MKEKKVKKRRTPPSDWGAQRAAQVGRVEVPVPHDTTGFFLGGGGHTRAAGILHSQLRRYPALASRIPPDPTSSPAAPDPRRRNVVAYPFIIYYSSWQSWGRRRKWATFFKGCWLWKLGGLRPDISLHTFRRHGSV